MSTIRTLLAHFIYFIKLLIILSKYLVSNDYCLINYTNNNEIYLTLNKATLECTWYAFQCLAITLFMKTTFIIVVDYLAISI